MLANINILRRNVIIMFFYAYPPFSFITLRFAYIYVYEDESKLEHDPENVIF